MVAMKDRGGVRQHIRDYMDRLFYGVRGPRLGLVLLILVYTLCVFYTEKTSRSEGMVFVANQAIPLRSLTGAVSSFGNICVFLMVVFYKKPGAIVSLVSLFYQIPRILMGIFLAHNYTSTAGLVMNFVAIGIVILLYHNNKQIDRYQARLRMQATTDMLTGLPNRFACNELLDTLIKQNTRFAVAVLNLNNFKRINNTMGVGTGNQVLAGIAHRWREFEKQKLSGTRNLITCQGGDEFALIVREYNSDEELINTITRYKELLEEKITIDGCDYYTTARIGYAEYPRDAKTAEALLACASTAMYESKNRGTDIMRYSVDANDAERSLKMERMIRDALEHGGIYYVLQPQFDITHRLSGFEALARMRDPDGNVVSPGDFIPVAEKLGLVDKIDRAVFRQSAEYFGKLIRETGTDSTLSVNISVRHLLKNDFLDEVRDILSTSGVPAGQLELEITESIMIDSVEKALQCINDIRDMGIKIAIDDFGTGYSSLSYLNNFPADMLKVDKSFIDRMNSNESSKKYVAAIISIGHVMNFTVISEGVEEPEQLDTLRSIGCDYIQGFLWGRPMSPENATSLVMESMKA